MIQILEIARLTYHSRIICGKRERRNKDLPPIAYAMVDEFLAERAIGRDTSCYG